MDYKVILEFNLPMQKFDAEAAMKGEDLALFVWSLREEVRGRSKYGNNDEIDWTPFYRFLCKYISDSRIGELIDSIP